MINEPLFPVELLNDTIDNRLTVFDRVFVEHSRFATLLKQLTDHILARDGKALILLIGPSRVGKSTLIEKLMEALMEIHKARLIRSRIPFGFTKCPATGGRFDWKDVYTRLLKSFDAPLINKIRSLPHKPLIPVKKESKSTTLMHNALEETIKMRNPYVIILDESGHVNRVPIGMTLKDQMDTLKSLSELSSCKFLIVGTPELKDLRDLSAQLIVRSEDFYFHRYFPHIKEDKMAYKDALFTFQNWCPLEEPPDLVPYLDTLIELTCGSVGLTHDLLLRALRFALNEKSKTISESNIARAAMSRKRRQQYLKETIDFELEVLEDENERKKLTKQLEAMGGSTVKKTQNEGNGSRKGNQKPGVRSPSRDTEVVILR